MTYVTLILRETNRPDRGVADLRGVSSGRKGGLKRFGQSVVTPRLTPGWHMTASMKRSSNSRIAGESLRLTR